MTPAKLIGLVGDEPITIADCRAHLEQMVYNDSDIDPIDDALILDKLGIAREHCENFLGLSLTTRTLEVALDRFPASTSRHRDDLSIELPNGPVREIVSVMVTPPDIEFTSDDLDSDSLAGSPIWADGTVNPSGYVLDDYSSVARLRPVGAWPSVTSSANAVKVRYLAGYGVDSEGGQELPKAIRGAILLTLGELFANRENAGDVQLHEIPTSAQALLRPLRVRLGMA